MSDLPEKVLVTKYEVGFDLVDNPLDAAIRQKALVLMSITGFGDLVDRFSRTDYTASAIALAEFLGNHSTEIESRFCKIDVWLREERGSRS